MSALKHTFLNLVSCYSDDNQLAETLWVEIYQKYSDRNRHYHTLSHLDSMYSLLHEIKNEIKDWDSMLFALFYHDIIYNSARSDNEEKSAELAEKRLQELSFPTHRIEKSVSMILATIEHLMTDDTDIDYFTDADVSILGQNWDLYSEYAKQVRLEYSNYPDFIYIPGRKKVLIHFLGMKCIFKMPYFYQRFERQARENITCELQSL